MSVSECHLAASYIYIYIYMQPPVVLSPITPSEKKTSQRPWLNAVASYHLGFHCGCVVDAGDDLIDEEDLDDLDDLDDDDD